MWCHPRQCLFPAPMLSELPLVERQTSLATPGPSLLVRIGRYSHPHRTVRASVSDGTCFRIGRYASATVISALLNGVSVRLFGVPLCVDVNMENTVNMHLFSNCLKKTIQKFCLFYISLYICRVIHFSVPSDRMCYTDLLSASQRRSPQWVGREMPMRGVLIVVNII